MIFSYIEDERTQSPEVPPMSDPVSATRVLCGALLLPTIASICGKIFFESVNSNFQRTLLVRKFEFQMFKQSFNEFEVIRS